MNETLCEFTFDCSFIRARLDESGKAWFVAKEVCAILDLGDCSLLYKDSLTEEEKECYTLETSDGPQEALVISESGLYALTALSKKAEAKRFRSWIIAEVLPALGKAQEELQRGRDRLRHAAVPDKIKLSVMRQLCLVAKGNPERARTLEQDFINMCTLFTEHPPVPQEQLAPLNVFWDIVRELQAKGHRLNHSPNLGFLAMNMPEFIRFAREAGYRVDRADLLRLLPYSQEPHFIAANRAIRSTVSHTVKKCWIFSLSHSNKFGVQMPILRIPPEAS